MMVVVVQVVFCDNDEVVQIRRWGYTNKGDKKGPVLYSFTLQKELILMKGFAAIKKWLLCRTALFWL